MQHAHLHGWSPLPSQCNIQSFDEDPLQGAEPPGAAIGFVSRLKPNLLHIEKAIFELKLVGKFLTISNNSAFAEEKASGCQPGGSLGRFHAGPSPTKLKLSPRTLHSAAVSADRYITPHGISMYVPGLRTPCSMGHGAASRSVAPCDDSWAGLVGTLTSGAPRPVAIPWATLSGAGRRCVAALFLASFSRLTRVDQDICESTSCRQVAYVHEAPHGL
eukprot:366432-Chlamydomonas_euryale.AAC.12